MSQHPVIAIPARNEGERLPALLDALGNQSRVKNGGQRLPVIVVLNNCTDNSSVVAAEAAGKHETLDVEVVQVAFPPDQAHVGMARRVAMEKALAASPDPHRAVLLTTDADAVPPPNWVEANLRAIDAGADIVGGHLVGDPIEEARSAANSCVESLLRILAAVGRGDLSVGRIFEGHVNALFLIRKFGTPAQKTHYMTLAADGNVFGVWNTDLPGEPLTFEGPWLSGKKNFASGIDGLSHAIVTARWPQGRLMIILPVAELPVDRSWWHPLGMRASGSHIVDFTGVTPAADAILGGPDDYVQEPWFSGGAIRFVAVQVGGMHAVFDAAVTHLQRTNRAQDPYQRQRIGRMGIAVESGYAWLDHAAEAWARASGSTTPLACKKIIATVNAARSAIETAALAVLEDAERGVGAAGLISPHPLERLIRDLRTYLRQPNPDGALASLGSAIADGSWSPGTSFNDGDYEEP